MDDHGPQAHDEDHGPQAHDEDHGPQAHGDEHGPQAHGDEHAGPDGAEALDEHERSDRLAQLQRLMDLMRSAVQADGGDLLLVSADVTTGVVEVKLQGACSSCAISSVTLQGGVERVLRERLPWITEVVGGLTETVDPYESAALGRGGYVPSF